MQAKQGESRWACAFLELATLAGLAWTAARLAGLTGEDRVTVRLRSLAEFYLCSLEGRSELLSRQALLGGRRLNAVQSLLDR